MDVYRGIRIGIIVHCENGYFAGGAGGGWIYDNNGKKVQKFVGDGGRQKHFSNFINAVRSRKASDLNADIQQGHLSSSLSHMANISHRIGRHCQTGQIRKTIKNNDTLFEALGRVEKHLLANELDLSKTPLISGPWLQMDPYQQRFVSHHSTEANLLLKDNYREPFVVPDKV